MTIDLSPAELRALRIALDNYLPELRYELARARIEPDRRELAELEAIMEVLRRKLVDPPASQPFAGPHALP